MKMKIAVASVLLCFNAGCTLYPVFTIDSKPFTNDGSIEKIKVAATVVTTPKLSSYVFRGNGWAYAYTGIGQDSVQMSRQLFDEVSIREAMPEPGEGEPQLIIVPEVIEIKEWGKGGVSLALIQEITLGWKAYAYPSQKLIYQTEETAQEQSYAGSMFSVESQAIERAQATVQAVFQQSLKNLSASYQLHQYASIPTLVNAPAGERISTALSILNRDSSAEVRSTMLYFAIDVDDYNLATELLKAGVDANTLDRRRGGLAQHVAAKKHDSRMLGLLLDHGAEVNALDVAGKNVLFYAVQADDQKLTTELFQRNAKIVALGNNSNDSYVSGKSYLALARFEEGKQPDALSLQNYSYARTHFEEATTQYQQLADDMSGAQRSAALKGIFLQVLGNAVIQYGTAKQAQLQDKQWQEITALQEASNSNTGLNGYYRNLSQLDSQIPVTTNPDLVLPNINNQESLDNKQVEQWIVIYEAAAANSAQIVSNIDERQNCLKSSENSGACPQLESTFQVN